jgi:hypothetical protein
VLSYTFSSAAGLSATQQEPAAHKGQAKESYACCALSKGPGGGGGQLQHSSAQYHRNQAGQALVHTHHHRYQQST